MSRQSGKLLFAQARPLQAQSEWLDIILLLAWIGFGIKVGTIGLHVWLQILITILIYSLHHGLAKGALLLVAIMPLATHWLDDFEISSLLINSL